MTPETLRERATRLVDELRHNAYSWGAYTEAPLDDDPMLSEYKAGFARARAALLALFSEGEEPEDEDGPPCTCDGDNLALQVLCRVFDDDPADVIEEWRAFDKSGWLWWGRALGVFISRRLETAHPAPATPERYTLDEIDTALYAAHREWDAKNMASFSSLMVKHLRAITPEMCGAKRCVCGHDIFRHNEGAAVRGVWTCRDCDCKTFKWAPACEHPRPCPVHTPERRKGERRWGDDGSVGPNHRDGSDRREPVVAPQEEDSVREER